MRHALVNNDIVYYRPLWLVIINTCMRFSQFWTINKYVIGSDRVIVPWEDDTPFLFILKGFKLMKCRHSTKIPRIHRYNNFKRIEVMKYKEFMKL